MRVSDSFEALHELIDEAIGDIHGIGPLTIYDIPLRIGARLGYE